jgi:hypothetical protein
MPPVYGIVWNLSHIMGTVMNEGKTPAQDVSALMAQGVDQARVAMQNYLKFFENSMSATPWASTELNRKLTDYARQNVDTAFEFAQKLTQAKDVQDLVRIQTEFFQTQWKSLTEQIENISKAASEGGAGSLKDRSGPSS